MRYLVVIAVRFFASGCSDIACPDGLIETDVQSCVAPMADESTRSAQRDAQTTGVDERDGFSAIFPWNGYSTGSVLAAGSSASDPLRPTFRWAEESGATSYEVQLADDCSVEGFRDCSFERPVVQEQTSETAWAPSEPLPVQSTPPVGARYYWRVRACTGQSCGPWTETRYLDVGRVPGDFNGDGYTDIVVGAPLQETDLTVPADEDEGHVYVYDGCDEHEIPATPQKREDPLQAPASFFGDSIATCDVDADGFADLVVGAYGAGGQGKAHVFMGSPAGVSDATDLTIDSPDAQSAGWFGRSVGCVGDINGDGFADVAIGAPLLDKAQLDEGRVFVFLGDETGLNRQPAQAIDSPTGQESGEFGTVISGGGDANGDGLSDFAVGAPRHREMADDEGLVFVYFGSRSGAAAVEHIILSTPDHQVNAQFGDGLTLSADLTDDGFADLAVGAPFYNGGAVAEGNAFVFFGRRDGFSADPSRTIDSPRNEGAGNFGSAMASGDLNGDGVPDLVVGAAIPTFSALNERVFVYFGGSTGIASANVTMPNDSLEVPGGDSATRFGASVATTGDVNGDGVWDLLVGEPGYDGTNADEGRALLFFGVTDGELDNAAVRFDNPLEQTGAKFGLEVR